MSDSQQTQGRTRLSDYVEQPMEPFVRAKNVSAISLYWMPVSQFPIAFRQREWILEFLKRVSEHFEEKQLLEEVFLGLKYTRQELNRRFTQTLLEYEPITGVVVLPGQGLPATPTSLEIKKLVDNPDANAEVNIQHLVPDYTAWFLQKKAAAQRKDFFGVGGMTILWVKPDPQLPPPNLQISKSAATHPAFVGHDLNGMMRKVYSMQAPWLKQSKEVFGAALKEDAMFQGVPFVLPKLDAATFTSATEQEISQWFTIFHACCIESEKDGGLLFAVAEPDFDETLQGILQTMADIDMRYPL